MLKKHGKAFTFTSKEIGCVDPKIVELMAIFTIEQVSWNLKPIPVPRAHIPKIIDLLKEKVAMGILEPSNAPYSNRWFTVLKQNRSLRFIQDLQPVNKVTIRKSGVGSIVDEFAEAFARCAIYSIGDLYSGYDQFQLAMDSREITTMRTLIGLVQLCTLPRSNKRSRTYDECNEQGAPKLHSTDNDTIHRWHFDERMYGGGKWWDYEWSGM